MYFGFSNAPATFQSMMNDILGDLICIQLVILGFANFYQKFIENFAKMSKPLSDLTKKDSTQTWGKEQQNAFEVLKKAFTMAPVLRIPNNKDPFKLSTNGSNFATGAVLSQKDIQTNLWHPVAFFSKLLNIHEKNYKIYNNYLQ